MNVQPSLKNITVLNQAVPFMRAGVDIEMRSAAMQKLKTTPVHRGFTLIELLVVVAVVAVLAAVAMPSYTGYVQRQKMRAAQADLAGLALQMENRFQRVLAYPGTTLDSAATQAVFPSWQPSAKAQDFDFRITASAAATFTVTAQGQGSMSGCNISLTQANVRTTSGCPFGAGNWL